MSTPSTNGFGVHPSALRRGAADLRADAQALDAARVAASNAAQDASGAVRGGPLAVAARDFAAQMDRAVGALVRSIEESAGALDASALDYAVTEENAARGLGASMLPGIDGPSGLDEPPPASTHGTR